MKKKELKIKVEGVKKVVNTLSGDAREFGDSIVAALEEMADDDEDHDVTSVMDKISELAAEFDKRNAEQDERTTEAIRKVRNEVAAMVAGGNTANPKAKVTAKVANDVCRVMCTAKSAGEAREKINAIAKEAGIVLKAKKNDLEGLEFAELVDYAIQFKQEDNDEIYDALYKTTRTKIFVSEIDSSSANQIAKGWAGFTSEDVKKAVQELNIEGKTITRKLVYKMQRIANEDIIRAEETGEWGALQSDLNTELRKGVKGVQVRAILIGDTVNANGSKVDTFETIGTKTVTDLFTTVVNPATPNTVTLVDVAKTAAAVKTDKKWAVMSSDLKLALRQHIYAAGGTVTLLSDDDLAAMIGVERIIEKDFISEVDGLHVIVFDPSEYWVNNGGELNASFPVWENNVQKIIHEQYVGGLIHGIKSSAILAENA